MSVVGHPRPASACVYYDQNRTGGPYDMDMATEVPDWVASDKFSGFFPAGPYGMDGDWGQNYPMAYVATWESPNAWAMPAVLEARAGFYRGLVPPDFWDEAKCEPSQAYWDWANLTAGPDELARNVIRNDFANGGVLGRVADAIDQNVPTPAQVWTAARKALVGGAEVVGEAGGTLLAAFTEAGARGSAKGVVAFWDGLPAAGQAALAIGGLVLAIAAVRKLTT